MSGQGNGSLLLEVPNRGNSRIVALVDGGDWDVKNDAGDAWLLRNGYTFVSVGWQWDAQDAGALRFFAPTAQENGKTVYGLLRGDLMPAKVLPEIPLGHLMEGHIGGVEYPVALPDDPRNVMTVRDSRDAPRTLIPRSEWQFAHTVDGKLSANDRFIHLNGGFQPGRIYEYVYVAANPSLPAVASLLFATLPLMPNTIPTPLLRRSAYTGKASRRTGAFYATFSMKVSTRMKREESPSTEFSRTWRELAVAASIIGSPSLLAMRSPRRQSSFLPTSFRLPIKRRKIPSLE